MTRRGSLLFGALVGLAVLVSSVDGQAAERRRPTPTVRLQRQLNRLSREVASQQLQIWALTDRLQGEDQALALRVENTELFDQWIEPLRGCVDGAFPAFFGSALIFDPSCLWPPLNQPWTTPHRIRSRSFRRPM